MARSGPCSVWTAIHRGILLWLHRNLAPNQLVQLPFRIVRRQPEGDALAHAATVEGHHQHRWLSRAAEPHDPKAERTVPTAGCAPSRLDMLQLGFPDQGALCEQPRVRSTRMRGKQILHKGVIVFIGVVGPGQIGPGIIQPAPTRADHARLAVIGRPAEIHHDLLSRPQPHRSTPFSSIRPCHASASPYRDGRMKGCGRGYRLNQLRHESSTIASMADNVTSPASRSAANQSPSPLTKAGHHRTHRAFPADRRPLAPDHSRRGKYSFSLR